MEDEKIVELYFRREETSIVETQKKYKHYLHSIGRNILQSHEDCEECENDTYGAAWNNIPPEKPQVLRLYLGRIMRNLSLNKFDYNHAKKRHGAFQMLLSELEDCVSGKETVEQAVDARGLSVAISGFLYGMEEEKRYVFIRRYWYGDSIATIAMEMNMSQSKVKSMLFRVRKHLRDHLEKEGFLL